MRLVLILLALVFAPAAAEAGKWLDYLRKYDLNDYGLGLAVSSNESPYIGAENSTFAYPYLTSFTHPALSDSWLVVRNGGIEARRITTGGWEFAVAGRIQTLGFGNHNSGELSGVAAPKWSIELGPSVGLRRWPVQVHLVTFFEPTDRHDGVTSLLSLSYPMGWSRGYLVPQFAAIYQDSKYTEYYYAIDADEATPTRPEYSPGDAMNTKASIVWGYALSEKWLLSGDVGLEYLADNIQDSPIVDSKKLWSLNLGLAYNADIFNASGYDFEFPDEPRFDIRIGAFHTNADTKIGRDTANGVPGDEIDFEDVFGESDVENVIQLDAVWRISRYHRLEGGFFELVRNGSTTITEDLHFGDQVYAPGTEIESRSHFKSLNIGYAYSLMRDSQKELGVMAGVHFSSFDSIISSILPDETERSSLEAPLPVAGVHGSINIGEKTKVAARLKFFRTDFDQYEGSLNYFTIDIQRRIGESVNLGIGYNYYKMKLRSSQNGLDGFIEIGHRGPVVFLGYNF
jgi:hypothetical protein